MPYDDLDKLSYRVFAGHLQVTDGAGHLKFSSQESNNYALKSTTHIDVCDSEGVEHAATVLIVDTDLEGSWLYLIWRNRGSWEIESAKAPLHSEYCNRLYFGGYGSFNGTLVVAIVGEHTPQFITFRKHGGTIKGTTCGCVVEELGFFGKLKHLLFGKEEDTVMKVTDRFGSRYYELEILQC